MRELTLSGIDWNVSHKTRILVVADQDALGESLEALRAAGHETVWRPDVSAALDWLSDADPDAILLQIDQNDASCLDLLDAVGRTGNRSIPVIAISPIDTLELRVSALNLGAGDYLVPPFSTAELLSRLATTLRRREIRQGRYLRLGSMLVDMETARLGDGMKWTWLTPKEWRVFSALLDRRDESVSRQHLKKIAAGTKPMSDNALEAMICRLRAKACGWGIRIRMLRGMGYMLETEPETLATLS